MRLTLFLLIIIGACTQLSDSPMVSLPDIDENNGWERLADGLEQGIIHEGTVIFYAVRIDPIRYTFRAHYQPSEALSINEWTDELPSAEVIINANFFTIDHQILGLLITDFTRYGTAYTDRGGMFYVAGDRVGIRNTVSNPYRGETFSQAIQAFPMLIENGQAVYNNSQNRAISRRTIIAQDTEGRIILMVTAGFGMSLYDLSQYLVESRLNIQTALNLDGGGSSMMRIHDSDTTILSFDPVPAVLAVYDR